MSLGRTARGPSHGRLFSVFETADATKQVDRDHHGTIFAATAGSGTQTFTLPLAGARDGGLTVGFLCLNAGGEILVNPGSSDYSINLESPAGKVAPAAGTGIKNTAGTNALGDNCVLVYVHSLKTWFGLFETSGFWASQ